MEKHTNLPPQTYFLTKTTPSAVLRIMTMMTVITMGMDLEEWLSVCEKNPEESERKTLVAHFGIWTRCVCVCVGTDQKFWAHQVAHASLTEVNLFPRRHLSSLTFIPRDFPITVEQSYNQGVYLSIFIDVK